MKKPVYALGVLILTACTSTPESPVNKTSQQFGTDTPVYGYLEKVNNEYTFSSFSLVSHKYGPWVKLNSLTPAFYTQEVNDCTTDGLIIDGNNTGLCDSDGPLFRSSLVSAGDIAESTLINSFAVVFSLGLGTGGVQGFYSTEFDADAFNNAVANASKKLDREKLFKDVANYKQRRIDETTNLMRKVTIKKASIKQNLRTKSLDKSGLFKKAIQRDYVKVNVVNPPSFPNVDTTWKNTQDLQAQLNKLLEKMDQDIQYTLSCERVSGWGIDISGCDKQWSNDSQIIRHVVKYSINSQNYRNLKFAPEYQDNSVKTYLAKDGITLMIENKTKRFLRLDAVSMYVGSKISTKNNLNIELPPLAYSEVARLDRFENYNNALNIRNATSVKLNKVALLGLALKYKVIELDKDKTLFKRQKVNLLKLPERS